jgi:hypothetical protein
MCAPRTNVFSALRAALAKLLAAPFGTALLAVAGCNGTAVVTLTSTPSTDNFLAYRVALVSVQLQESGGKSGLAILPSSTTVDLATLTNVSEVLGAAPVKKGDYKSALITLDYGSAQIVYDNGSLNGLNLTPVGANGQALGQVQVTVTLDPGDSFSVSTKGASQMSLGFNLAASNVINLANNTVTVTPLIAGSALPIDAKQVRIRGPLGSVADNGASTAVSGSFSMGVVPFNGLTSGVGQLSIIPTDVTTYEVNGAASTGSAGLTQLAALGADTLAVAYGTLTSTDATTTTTVDGAVSATGSSTVTFAATQVLAGSSVQGAGLDRLTGTVAAISGDAVSIEDGTLVANDGTETFLGATSVVAFGPNTAVTVFGQGAAETNSALQITVGSAIDAFGVATSEPSGPMLLDATAGRVRLDTASASGLVTVQGSGYLTLKLATLGGRALSAFDFYGTGVSPGDYIVSTGALDLTNSTTGAPVVVTGLTGSFGVTSPDFTASTLLDPTTIQAELAVDWGGGTAAPFVTYNSTAIDLDVKNSSIGARHLIEVGPQSIDIVGLSSDPLITPDATASATVYSIGHSVSGTIENFNTYAAFIAQLQAELSGTVLATGITAIGQYTASTYSFSATSITIFLKN